MELRRLLGPTLHLTLATMMNALTGLLFWWGASRFYSPADVGAASAIISFMNLTFALSTLGLNIGLIRFYDRFGERGAGTTLLITTLLSVLVIASYAALNPRGVVRGWSTAAGIIITGAFGAAYNVFGYLAIAAGKTGTYVGMSVAYGSRVVPVPFIRELGAQGLILSFAAGIILGLLYGAGRLRRYIQLSFDQDFLRESIGVSLSNHLGNVVNLVPMYLMPTIILLRLGREWTGYYYIGFTVGNLLLVPLTALGTILIREWRRGEGLEGIFLLLTAYWAISTAGVWALGAQVLGLFGSGYTSALGLLKAMALGVGPVGATYVELARLTVEKKPKIILILNSIRGVVFLALGYLLLGPYGITGVGIAWTLAHLTAVGAIWAEAKDPKTF